MANIQQRRFVPTGEDVANGALPMTQEEILTALQNYKAQNPVKYEAKKAALFKRYGLADEQELAQPEPDASDVELVELKKKVTKKTAKAKAE